MIARSTTCPSPDASDARTAASTDALTGLLNHGAFQIRVREEIARAGREGQPLACVLLDLDDFKRVNDEQGHLAGDTLLRQVAAALRGPESFDDAQLVTFGLQAADEPGTAVRKSFVVEIHWILRRQYAAQSEGAGLLEQREHRRLRGGVRAGREIAEDLVHVEDGAQARRA